MKIFIKAILGVILWMTFLYIYAVKISGSNAGVNMLVFFVSLFLFLIYIVWAIGTLGMWLIEMRNRRILTDGLPAEGIILGVRETGLKVTSGADFPRYGTVITVEVAPSEGEKFRADLKMMLAEHEIAGLAAGTQVRVRYNPEKRDGVALESF
jgi:hypothetical protein